MPQTRVGISGWIYKPWRGVFYPENLPQKDELYYASRQVNSIEINGSFYSLQRPASYEKWYEQTPADFVFSVKGARYITHMKRLKGGVPPLANFFASGVLCLKEKLGPILWQLPPSLKYDEGAKRHDARMKGRAWTTSNARRPLRYAIEVRHESFRDPSFVRLARRHNVAVCVADSAGTWPYFEDVPADFVYCRLHGAEQLYASGYTGAELERWAARLKAWRAGRQPADPQLVAPDDPPKPRKARDVYVYFDNDVKVHAPYDATHLAARLAGKSAPARDRKTPKAVAETPRTRWPTVRPRQYPKKG